ncbi:ArpU family phage packaging/lysis transcriptional regulator [Salipaludibacillus sp. HK11]|uniref:ArpU family phage packaging/lysis transcriptional regulator n=1 Tax=Salipaludibacillus sp. HK11 TaxID=3394320 RepID=UPI0039FCB476
MVEELTLGHKDIAENEVQKALIDELRNYRSLKIKLQNRKEQIEKGVLLFPSLRAANGIKNIDEAEELYVKQVDRALEGSIDDQERTIINRKYLQSIVVSDVEIYSDIGMKKGKYYVKKKSAIINMARALDII